jgi:hypothetical protein
MFTALPSGDRIVLSFYPSRGGYNVKTLRRSSDFQELSAGDVLKSCKRTGRAWLQLSSVRKPGCELQNTADEFQLERDTV